MKPKMTFEEHKTLGAELRVMSDRLAKIHVDLSNTYGHSKKTSTGSKLCRKYLDQVRCELDEILFREYPDIDGDEKINTYFGTAGRI